MRWVVAALVFVLAVAALAAVGWPAAKYIDNDFFGFWAGSRALLEGLDPYDVTTWLALHERFGSRGLAVVPPRTGFGYPLTTALLFAPIALLPIAIAAPVWLVSQVTVALAALYALGRQLFASSLRRDLVVLVGLAAAGQPFWLLAHGGNLGGFLLAIAAASVASLLANRPFAAGALAGLLVMKPHTLFFAVPLLLVALPRDRALRLLAGGAAVALPLVIATVVLQPGWIGEWLTPVSRIANGTAGRATMIGALAPELRVFGWVAVAFAIVAFWRWSRGRPLAIVIGAAVPLAILFAPYGWSYDQTVLFVTAAIVLAVVANGAPLRRVLFLLALALVLALLPWALYGIAFRRGDEALSVVTPLAMLAVLGLSARAYGTMRA